jgi:electron transfer flavoprotein beta subunit
MFNIVVCAKAVPDPEDAANIKIDPATKTLTRGKVSMVLNPLDKNALEAAVQIKERTEAHITVISMGPPEAANIVKECLALGADQGVLLSDRAFAGGDTLATAFTLAKGIEKNGAFDLVLCGMASSDGSTEWVGPQIATILGVPVVTLVKEIVESEGDCWKVKASLDNGYRLVGVKLPAVLTVTLELNSPRTLKPSGIIKARKKEITQWGIDDLGVSEESVGLKGSPTIVSALHTLESKREVEIIEGTRDEKAEQLLQRLTDSGLF